MTEKACFRCGETKPIDAFYRHPKMGDGHLNKCIDCTKADAKEHRSARIDEYRAYDRQRSKLPHRVEARQEYARTHVLPPRPERDPQKRAARTAVSNAVRDGRLIRPTVCEICNVSTQPHGHHDDYSKPLDVIWCCTACHALIHAYWRAQERKAA